jgi:hypothetical protein
VAGYGDVQCIVNTSNSWCIWGAETSDATIEISLSSPSEVGRIIWGTGGGHETGVAFSYKTFSNSTAWTDLTGTIPSSSPDWGSVNVAVLKPGLGKISAIKYSCLGDNWCKVVYLEIFEPSKEQ